MTTPTTIQNAVGVPIYKLGTDGSAIFAGDVTLGKVSRAEIPAPNTVTLYTTDGTSVNMIDNTGAVTLVSSGTGTPTFTNINYSGTLTGPSGIITPSPNDGNPQMSGVNAWNFDPEIANSGGLLVTTTIYLHKIIINTAVTATNIVVGVTTQGGTLTSGQNLCAIYNSSGTRLAITVDQTVAWGTSGGKACALTAPVALPAGTYYIGILSNGTTPITVAESPGFSQAYNNVQAASLLRHSTNGTGTTLPASVTLASNVSSARSTWVGIS